MSVNCEEAHLQPTRGPRQPHIKRASSAVMYDAGYAALSTRIEMGPSKDLSQGRMKGEAEASAKQRLTRANRTGQTGPSHGRDLYQRTSAEDTWQPFLAEMSGHQKVKVI